MCAMIATRVKIEGSGKGANGWFKLREANVLYDQPFDAPLEHPGYVTPPGPLCLCVSVIYPPCFTRGRAPWQSAWPRCVT